MSEQTTKLLVGMLLRLDNKLCRSGVDDSDGTVGGFIEETVQVLKEYAKLDPACTKAFSELKDKETCFGLEEPLLEFVKYVAIWHEGYKEALARGQALVPLKV